MKQRNINSRRCLFNTYPNQPGRSDPYSNNFYGVEMPLSHRGAGSMQENSYDGAAPFSDSVESAQTDIPLSPNENGFQQPAFNPQVNHSAAPQGFPEYESSIAVGTGGYAYAQADPSNAMNTIPATELEITPDSYNYPHCWNASNVQSYSSEHCIDPRLTVNVVDFDALQTGAQQTEPMHFIDPHTNLEKGDFSHDGSSLDRRGTYNGPTYSQHPLLIDQMTANTTADQLHAPTLTELEDVPFAQRSLMPNPPLFPFPGSEQSVLHNSRNENGVFSTQNALSERGTSPESPYRGRSSMSDIGYLASTAASWDLGFVPRDSDTAALSYMSRPHQQVPRRGSRASQGAMSDHSRDDLRRSLKNLNIDSNSTQGGTMSTSRSEQLYASNVPQRRHSQTSLASSVLSTASSTARPCPMDGCDAQFKGRYGQGNLARHIRLIHNRRDYRCDFCEKSFRRQDARKKHIEKQHMAT